jgi:hypothetical protein
MQVTKTLGFAEPDPIDDRSMVQFIRNNGILVVKKRFKHAAIGVKSRGIKDGILGSQELRDLGFQFFMNVLGSANEADAA